MSPQPKFKTDEGGAFELTGDGEAFELQADSGPAAPTTPTRAAMRVTDGRAPLQARIPNRALVARS